MTGAIVWFTGLPASGKSTLATRTQRHLVAAGRTAILLDGDAVHVALGNATYGTGDRDAFYRALAELAAMIARQDAIVLVAATAPRAVHREHARATGVPFVEVWVQTPLAECEARDDKGLYARARKGEITTLPGVGVAFEPPEHPDIIASGGHDDAAITAVGARLGVGARAQVR